MGKMRLKWHVGKQCEQTAVCVTSVARARGTTSANARSTLFDFFFFCLFSFYRGVRQWRLALREGRNSELSSQSDTIDCMASQAPLPRLGASLTLPQALPSLPPFLQSPQIWQQNRQRISRGSSEFFDWRQMIHFRVESPPSTVATKIISQSRGVAGVTLILKFIDLNELVATSQPFSLPCPLQDLPAMSDDDDDV